MGSNALFRRPLSTYRVQLGGHFDFDDAAAIVPYLDALGITDLYTSPILRAAAGSSHGYDVVDHATLNPELGGEEGYGRLAAVLAERGMGHLLDFVPNHMAIGDENARWMDVLESGPSSTEADFFDIDWHPVKEELENRLLVPVLGEQYGAALERGELALDFQHGAFSLRYGPVRFPIAPRTWPTILEDEGVPLGADDVHGQEFLSILHGLRNLPPPGDRDPHDVVNLSREKEVLKRRLAALYEDSPAVRERVAAALRALNGRPGDPRSFDRLDALLARQTYRLAYWRVAAEEINYRRFFDINNLAAIRMEIPAVMRATHEKALELIVARNVTGLRIDHPDGLYDPRGYFDALQRLIGEATGVDGDRPFYVVAEKILTGHEKLPVEWAIHGTTGYDFLAALDGLFVETRHARAFDELFTRFTKQKLDFGELVYQKRRQTMSGAMSSEINVLARQLNRLSELDRRTRDYTLGSLKHALIEVIACFPVYRTYLRPDSGEAAGFDRDAIERAVHRARRRDHGLAGSVFDFVQQALLGADGTIAAKRREFALEFQQVTAPVMAKAVEDTVFYHYNRLVSLNEVGGEPQRFGTTPERFRTFVAERSRLWPMGMLATSTHDTKRSEDVRARLAVLSEIPVEWRKRLSTWARLNRRHKVRAGDELCPDANEELLFYQSLLGAAPPEGEDPTLHERLNAYLLKAMREAKVHTSWVEPSEAWEAGARAFVDAVFDPRRSARFWSDFAPFHARIARLGAINSLAMLTLKLVLPGASDFYQGTELWDLSLVDPDNRRPVDYEVRRRMLDELDRDSGLDPMELVERWRDGRIKLFVASRLLRLKRSRPALFMEGELSLPVATGEAAERVFAVARSHGEERLVALVPRMVTSLTQREPWMAGEAAWGDTWVPLPEGFEGSLVDVFTGRAVPVERRETGPGVWARDAFSGVPVVVTARG